MVDRSGEALDMRQVVGANVRAYRKLRGLSQQELIDQLAKRGVGFVRSRPAVVALELGTRGIDVRDLFALAVVLGVSPQLLLMPPPGSSVVTDPREDPRSDRFPARTVAHWLWDPDDHELSTAGVRERNVWLEVAEVADRATPEMLATLGRQVRATDEVEPELEGSEDS